MSFEMLKGLGIDPIILETIELNKQEPHQTTKKIEKYKEAGFSYKVKTIKRSEYLKKTPFLIIRPSVDGHYNVLDGYGSLPHIHLPTKRFKNFFGTRQINPVLALIPVSIYKGDVPMFILDTIIKNKTTFKDFAIGVPGKAHAQSSDPVLFGTNDKFPTGSLDGERRIDLHILGVWGDDWHELDLRRLESTANGGVK